MVGQFQGLCEDIANKAIKDGRCRDQGTKEGSGSEYAGSFEVCVKMSFTKLLRIADVVFGAQKKEYAVSFEDCVKISLTKLFRMADVGKWVQVCGEFRGLVSGAQKKEASTA